MNTSLESSKKKLTQYFVGVVFGMIFIFGVLFLTGKLVADIRYTYSKLEKFAYTFDRKNISLPQMDGFIAPRKYDRGWKKEAPPFMKFPQDISYISVSKTGEVLHSNIVGEYDNQFLDFITENIDADKVYYVVDGYFVKNIKKGKKDIILFTTGKYTFGDMLKDFALLVLLDIIFCIFVYNIGKVFIAKVFQPVAENIDDMNNFVHNAGHELKTPITVMDSNLQLMISTQSYDADMFQEMKTELKNMNGLIESLLSLSDISSIQQTQKNNLGAKVDEVIKYFSSDISQKGIHIKIDIPKNIQIEANESNFSIFLTNIIKNAIKYNKKNGKIDILYQQKVLLVADTGIGIETKNLPKIFDRFYREEQARSKQGVGVGLSLVKKIADIYRWKIKVKSKKGEGTQVEVSF